MHVTQREMGKDSTKAVEISPTVEAKGEKNFRNYGVKG